VEDSRAVEDIQDKDSPEEEDIVEEDTDSFAEDILEVEVDRTRLAMEGPSFQVVENPASAEVESYLNNKVAADIDFGGYPRAAAAEAAAVEMAVEAVEAVVAGPDQFAAAAASAYQHG
jgi:hypothetical protein